MTTSQISFTVRLASSQKHAFNYPTLEEARASVAAAQADPTSGWQDAGIFRKEVEVEDDATFGPVATAPATYEFVEGVR